MNDISKIIPKNELINKNILFLQGPMSPFFKEIAKKLEIEYECSTNQICFNGGDEFYAYNKIVLNKKKDENQEELKKIISNKNIDFIFLLGDEREIHKKIIKWAKNKRVKVYIFEEGYFRPDYITLEKNGVNFNSELDVSASVLEKLKLEELKENYIEPKKIKSKYKNMATYAIIYYLFMYLKKKKYKYYIHHKDTSLINEALSGVKSYIKYIKHKFSEKKYKKILNGELNKKFIFFPLQVWNDFQIKSHSDFNSIEESIEHFFKLYKKYNLNDYVVIKHHPMDRGKKEYKKAIKKLINKYNIDNKKIIYIYDVDLPTCLRSAKKCVTVNSTVGISALLHNLPVYVMGRAKYDIKGITNTKEEFFDSKNIHYPNKKLFEKYKLQTINKTQINGSFYF